MYLCSGGICEILGSCCVHEKTRCVIFSKSKTKYRDLTPFVYDNRIIPCDSFCKYLGVEISDNCEFRLVKNQRVFKARKAIFTIIQALTRNGNVSVDLAMKLFDTKIESIFTYGSIVWKLKVAIINLVAMDGL